MTTGSEPQLAPPGAGLPALELFIGRILFALRRRTGDRESFNAQFQKERVAIGHLVERFDPEAAARRVLIPRPRGLEDSSRNWSVWMTLDHLRIVNEQIGQVIAALAKGSAPARTASTAAVKPSPEADADVAERYEKGCDELLATVAGVNDLKTEVCFAHPWFGPLDAAAWHAMAAGHMGLHRVQLERMVDVVEKSGR